MTAQVFKKWSIRAAILIGLAVLAGTGRTLLANYEDCPDGYVLCGLYCKPASTGCGPCGG